MSEILEVEQDRINEQEAIEKFITLKEGCTYKKLGKFDLDFLIYDNEGDAFSCVEVKCTNRLFNIEKYPYQNIAFKKLVKMQEYRMRNGIPVYLLYRYVDCLAYIEICKMEGVFKWDGRRIVRENAPNDKELMAGIDKSLMKIL